MSQKEELLFQKRFIDLSRLANRKNFITFSNFLNVNELHLFCQTTAELESGYRLFGGYEFAERQIAAFLPDAFYDIPVEFPITCLTFSPSHLKFAEDLTHRDILGALMHLGVERSRIGDIRIDGQTYYIFCEDSISDYLLENICQIRRTTVTGSKANPDSIQIQQKFEQIEGIVSSNRLDAVVAFATRKSRSQSLLLIQSQKVFVNSCVMLSNAYACKEGDVISIRGFGKFIYLGETGETKKGRIKIQLKKYI